MLLSEEPSQKMGVETINLLVQANLESKPAFIGSITPTRMYQEKNNIILYDWYKLCPGYAEGMLSFV